MQDSNRDHIYVWDLPTRLFHWAVVSLVVTSWITADQGYMRVHLWSGLTVTALLLFRVIWGLIGSTTARFSDFVRSPRCVWRYLRGRPDAARQRHAGHNPAGGWMVIAMLSILFLQVGTGLFSNDGIRFNGPFALHVSSDTSDHLTSLHGALFNVLLALTYMHVVAVFYYLLVKGDNLIGPMLTGQKLRQRVPPGTELRFVRSLFALALFTLLVAATWLFVVF